MNRSSAQLIFKYDGHSLSIETRGQALFSLTHHLRRQEENLKNDSFHEQTKDDAAVVHFHSRLNLRTRD